MFHCSSTFFLLSSLCNALWDCLLFEGRMLFCFEIGLKWDILKLCPRWQLTGNRTNVLCRLFFYLLSAWNWLGKSYIRSKQVTAWHDCHVRKLSFYWFDTKVHLLPKCAHVFWIEHKENWLPPFRFTLLFLYLFIFNFPD